MKRNFVSVVPKPRTPKAVLQVLHSKKGGAMRDKRIANRSSWKLAVKRELYN